MLIHFYLRKGTVFLPTIAEITSGANLDCEPVAVVPVSKTADLYSALEERLINGNPVMSLPEEGYPKPVVLKYAGVKSFATFARDALMWAIKKEHDRYRITMKKKHPGSGWVDDPDQIITLPPASTVGDVCDRMVAILQAHAR